MKKINAYTFAIILSTLIQINGVAQDNRPAKVNQKSPKKNFADSLYYGGNLGLQFFGNSGSLVDLSPNIGYKFNKFLSVGVQGIFTNITQRYSGFTYRYMFYGAGTFVRVKPLPYLFLQAEYDVLSVPDAFSAVASKRTIADINLAGLGLRNQMGENSCYYFLVMYEFVPTPNSPYTYGPFGSPLVYRAGFNINF
ncbi:MAG: hypothetical protein Q8M29_11845 [Bacteroidota bacterium]|nr:hypothetical protein [Bacteroidota bacterium]